MDYPTNIQTLIPDIQKLVTTRGWFDNANAQGFASNVAGRLQDQFARRAGPPTLRLSQMGARCPKALWHSIHTPTLGEALPPWAEVKYSFGHVIEALAIALAKESS